MVSHIVQPADILLPADADMTKWSVIACDQYTSDQKYWAQADSIVGEAPSTLRLMLPECYLGKCDESAAVSQIQQTMRSYIENGVFRKLEHSFVYLERTLPEGTVRRGLIGMVDLEAYDYQPDSVSPIRATEGTVESRLPPRIQVRSEAVIEMPHIMLFFNDSSDLVMTQAKACADMELYDFDLMLGGGHVVGRGICGQEADRLAEKLEVLTASSGMRYAVGDGNHSLAAARAFWQRKRETLAPSDCETDPARYALVELVNIHDPAITFEPIHRVLFATNADSFFFEAEQMLSGSDASRSVTLLAGGQQKRIRVRGASIGEVIDRVEQFCRAFVEEHGGEIDYIHGDAETIALASTSGNAGVLLPSLAKDELFSSVEQTGPFPKKSFSIGLGPDKRYYLECRKIK